MIVTLVGTFYVIDKKELTIQDCLMINRIYAAELLLKQYYINDITVANIKKEAHEDIIKFNEKFMRNFNYEYCYQYINDNDYKEILKKSYKYYNDLRNLIIDRLYK